MASALDAAHRAAPPEQVSAWVHAIDGSRLAARQKQLRAIERIPAKEVVEEVTRADAELAESLRDALRLVQEREDRGEIPTTLDALATRDDAVAVEVAPSPEHAAPPRPRPRALWVTAASLAVATALMVALGGSAAPQQALAAFPTEITIAPPPSEPEPAPSASPEPLPAVSATRAVAPRRPKPNCTPNYYYENGIKRYKRHCL
jgi:hypothetical protein